MTDPRIAELETVLAECREVLQWARVYVFCRAKAKMPEGGEIYDAALSDIDHALDENRNCKHNMITGEDNDHITWNGWGYCSKCGALAPMPDT